VNGDGDSFTESAGLRYSAAVEENLSGWYIAQVFESGGDLLYTGSVKVASDNGSYLIDDPQATIASIDVGDITVSDVEVASFSSSALTQLAGTRVINVSVPTLNGGQLSAPLIRGDTYSAALDSALEFSRNDFPDLPEGTTAQLTARKCEGVEPTSFTISGTEASIPVRSGTKVVRFEPTGSQTALWEPGKYEFDVQVTWPDGRKRTFVGPNVYLRVLADVTDN